MRRSVPGTVAGLTGPLTILVLLLLPGSTAVPITAAPVRLADLSDAHALGLLQRAADAPATTTYTGVQFVSAWTDTASTSLLLDIDHWPGGTSVRSHGTARAPATHAYLPARTLAPSISASGDGIALLARNYVVTTAGTGRVAGRAVEVVEARQPKARVAAARFWLDRSTGLVLRREVYDERGRVTRASAFVEVAVSPATEGQPADDRAEMTERGEVADAWPEALDRPALARMASKGWECPYELPGSLRLVDARRGGPPGGRIVHLSYSDGLAALSLFVQRGRLDTSGLGGYRRAEIEGRWVYVREGVPERVTWSSGGRVYTLLADAPPRTVDQVVAALPHAPADDGAMGRLGRGLDRVASWFNPFG